MPLTRTIADFYLIFSIKCYNSEANNCGYNSHDDESRITQIHALWCGSGLSLYICPGNRKFKMSWSVVIARISRACNLPDCNKISGGTNLMLITTEDSRTLDNFSASLIPAVVLDLVRLRSGTRSSFLKGEIRGGRKKM